MTVDLFHRRSGQGPTIVLLHGLFGSSDNWGTVARALSERFDVVLADLRDHGRSPHTEATDYTLMAADSSQIHEIRKRIMTRVAAYLAENDWRTVVDAMVTGGLAKDLMADARAVFPVRRIEVIKSKMLSRAPAPAAAPPAPAVEA